MTEVDSLKSKGRRNLILGIGAIIGTSAAVKLLTTKSVSEAVMYTPNVNSGLAAGKVLSQQEILMLKEICALAIPTTDTLGAADVDVHGFIDHQLFACHGKEQQEQVKDVLNKIEKVTLQKHKINFLELNDKQQLEILNSLEQVQKEFDSHDKNNFNFLKALIIFGYYTSEVGASKELTYLGVPGGYTGSVALDSVRSAQAPTAFY